MRNTFTSIVAAGILAAGDTTNAQEGADSTANKTKQALVELLSELPPGFDSARKVIEGDITLAGDGDLSDSDKLVIEGHMGKLATVIPESARKVREAMTGVETIVAADQVAPLNESPEERKARLERERIAKVRANILEEVNDKIMEANSWKSLPPGKDGIDSDVKIRRSDGGVSFSISKDSSRGQAFYRKELPPGRYVIKASSTGKIGIWWKGGKEIALTDGTPAHLELTNAQEVDVYVKPNALSPNITISDFSITESGDVQLVQEGNNQAQQ